MVDENGKQTITNDGATVMKVTIVPFKGGCAKSNFHSSSILYTPPPAS